MMKRNSKATKTPALPADPPPDDDSVPSPKEKNPEDPSDHEYHSEDLSDEETETSIQSPRITDPLAQRPPSAHCPPRTPGAGNEEVDKVIEILNLGRTMNAPPETAIKRAESLGIDVYNHVSLFADYKEKYMNSASVGNNSHLQQTSEGAIPHVDSLQTSAGSNPQVCEKYTIAHFTPEEETFLLVKRNPIMMVDVLRINPRSPNFYKLWALVPEDTATKLPKQNHDPTKRLIETELSQYTNEQLKSPIILTNLFLSMRTLLAKIPNSVNSSATINIALEKRGINDLKRGRDTLPFFFVQQCEKVYSTSQANLDAGQIYSIDPSQSILSNFVNFQMANNNAHTREIATKFLSAVTLSKYAQPWQSFHQPLTEEILCNQDQLERYCRQVDSTIPRPRESQRVDMNSLNPQGAEYRQTREQLAQETSVRSCSFCSDPSHQENGCGKLKTVHRNNPHLRNRDRIPNRTNHWCAIHGYNTTHKTPKCLSIPKFLANPSLVVPPPRRREERSSRRSPRRGSPTRRRDDSPQRYQRRDYYERSPPPSDRRDRSHPYSRDQERRPREEQPSQRRDYHERDYSPSPERPSRSRSSRGQAPRTTQTLTMSAVEAKIQEILTARINPNDIPIRSNN